METITDYALEELTTAKLMSELVIAHEKCQPSGDEHCYDCGMQDYFADLRAEAGGYKDAITDELKRRGIEVVFNKNFRSE